MWYQRAGQNCGLSDCPSEKHRRKSYTINVLFDIYSQKDDIRKNVLRKRIEYVRVVSVLLKSIDDSDESAEVSRSNNTSRHVQQAC